MNWLKSKKVIFNFSILLVILFSWFANYNLSDVLSNETSKGIFWISIPILFFSLIFSFLNNKYYQPWFNFSLYSYLLFIFLAFMPFIKESDFGLSGLAILIFIFIILYSLISLGIIIYQSFKKN